MSGNLVSVSPSIMNRQEWDRQRNRYTYSIRFPHGINENDTYISIFNVQTVSYYNDAAIEGSQKLYYDLFVKHPNVKIVWESKLAVNRRPGYGKVPRNEVVVWEYVNKPSN